MKGQNIFEIDYLLFSLLLEVSIRSIQYTFEWLQCHLIGSINWDVEIYKNKFEKFLFYRKKFLYVFVLCGHLIGWNGGNVKLCFNVYFNMHKLSFDRRGQKIHFDSTLLITILIFCDFLPGYKFWEWFICNSTIFRGIFLCVI